MSVRIDYGLLSNAQRKLRTHATRAAEYVQTGSWLARDFFQITRWKVVPVILCGAAYIAMKFAAMGVTRRDAGTDPVLVSPPPVPVHGRRILLVDETCDSGDTLKLALATVRGLRPADVRTAVSFSTGRYEPDFCALKSESLIVLPWDREIVSGGELVIRPDYAQWLGAAGQPPTNAE